MASDGYGINILMNSNSCVCTMNMHIDGAPSRPYQFLCSRYGTARDAHLLTIQLLDLDLLGISSLFPGLYLCSTLAKLSLILSASSFDCSFAVWGCGWSINLATWLVRACFWGRTYVQSPALVSRHFGVETKTQQNATTYNWTRYVELSSIRAAFLYDDRHGQHISRDAVDASDYNISDTDMCWCNQCSTQLRLCNQGSHHL